MTQALWVLYLLLLAAGYIAAPSGPGSTPSSRAWK